MHQYASPVPVRPQYKRRDAFGDNKKYLRQATAAEARVVSLIISSN